MLCVRLADIACDKNLEVPTKWNSKTFMRYDNKISTRICYSRSVNVGIMAKYLRNALNSVIIQSISIPNRVLSLLRRTYNHIEQTTGDDAYIDEEAQRIARQRVLKVAIIGAPNSGKSTFIDCILQLSILRPYYTVSPSPTKVITHRVLIEEDRQIVFLDTPGLVDSKEMPKNDLENATTWADVLKDADVICVIHDVTHRYAKYRLDPEVLKVLELNADKDSVLVLNKIDQDKEDCWLHLAQILTCFKFDEDIIYRPDNPNRHMLERSKRILYRKCKRIFDGYKHFKRVFMVSSESGRNVNEIKDYLLRKTKLAPWIFPKNVIPIINDIKKGYSNGFLIEDIKYSLQHVLSVEIRDNIQIKLDCNVISYEGHMHIIAIIYCDTQKIENLVMEIFGSQMKDLTRRCEQYLKNLYTTDVLLKFFVTKKQSSIPPIAKALIW